MSSPHRTHENLGSLIRAHAAIWVGACLGVALSAGALWVVKKELAARRSVEFQWVAHNRIGAFRQGIRNGLNAVKAVRDLRLASEDLKKDQFRSFALSTMARYRGIQALMWVPHVSHANRASYEARDHNAGGANQIKETATGRTVPAQRRQSYFPVQYVEPHEENAGYLGFDLSSNPAHRKILQRARSSRAIAMSGRSKLLVKSGMRYGFLAYLPVFGRGEKSANGASSDDGLLGFAVGVFRLHDLAEASVSLLEPRGVEFMIRDESAPPGQQFLDFYASRLSRGGASRPTPKNHWSQRTGLRFKQVFPVADRKWSATCAPTAQFRSAIAFQQSQWIVLGVGLLFTALITLYLVINKRRLLERVGMQRALKEREELFWQITETSDDVFWAVDLESDRYLYVSRGYEAVWGDSCDSLYSQPLALSNAIIPEDQHRYFAALRDIRQGIGTEVTYRVVRPDGTTRWIRDCGFPVRNDDGAVFRIVGVAEDITERWLADQALLESEEKLRTLFNYAPDVIMTIDHEGRILMMNRSTPKLRADKAVGEDSAMLLPSDFRQLYRRKLKKVFNKGKAGHLRYSTSEGLRWEVRIVPVSLDDPITAAIVVATDVTENEVLQEQMMRNARLATVGVLAAGVAHEINNPTNAIQFNASLFARVWQDTMPILAEYFEDNGDFSIGGLSFAEAGQTLPRLLDDIRRNAGRIKRIVENLKHLVKQDSRDLSQEVDVRGALEEAVMILHNKIQKYTDAFTLEVAEDLPPTMGNTQQLEQVFINVIFNALQALPNRNAAVWVGARYEAAKDCVQVEVRDEGCGIAKEQLSELTRPFFSTKADAGGTGLGLSISASILERHGGTIAFESELGRGTSVVLKLPVRRTSQQRDQ